MPGLHLYTSNRLEALQEKMAARFKRKSLPPLQKEIIIVQSRGMERWLNLEIARQNGICAHVEYLFPKVFVYNLFRQVLDIPETTPFNPEINTWRILKHLPELVRQPDTDSVANYIRNDPSGMKHYQLSQKIAEAFDRYTIMRSELVTAWDQGANPLSADFRASRWQAVLWQLLRAEDGTDCLPPHHAALKKVFLETPDPPLDLPERISVFGISTLPPYYIDIFQKIARRVDVDIYYLNPCREYWEYAYSAKQIAHFTEAGVPEEDTYYDCGNSLLASMGSAGREFFSLVLNSIGDTGEDLFREPAGETLLAAVQSDILNLRQPQKGAGPPVADTDTSIRIHASHSPYREVEVLHDQLLHLFSEYPDLQPTDVVVMMPDVAPYAPLIQAVFDSQTDEVRIPYSIADTRIRSSNPLADPFMAIVDIHRKRYRASAVLDILETAAVRRRFGIDAGELEIVKRWVDETAICWGIDGAYRADLELPAFPENTWQFGLDRLLLGYALPPGDIPDLFADILPYGEVEEDSTRVLGALANFLHTLFKFADDLNHPRSLEQWTYKLNELLALFFHEDDSTEDDIEQIRDTLTESGLAGYAQLAKFHEPVSLEVIRTYLEKRIGGEALTFGFISYGITFCTLLPMRSIPFKVVCLLGMNDGEYPRNSQAPGFDLMASKRYLCDWSKRHEDRYLFLESLLSARQHLLISYVGRSLKDNSDLPPSVLVSELLDYLDAAFETATGRPLHEQLLIRHPLQPFSHRYFQGDADLFSYSDPNCKAARRNLAAKKPDACFPAQPLPAPLPEAWRQVSVRQICRFFNNPPEFLTKHRLRVNWQPRLDTDLAEDREPFELDALQAYFIKGHLVDLDMAAVAPDQVTRLVSATGRLPHGRSGALALSGYQREARQFSAYVKSHLPGDPAPPVEVMFKSSRGPKTSIVGMLPALYTNGQLFYRCADLKARDVMAGWIHHLLLNTQVNITGDRTTIVIGKDRKITFRRLDPDVARAGLENLTGYFERGLVAPLCFFPEASHAFAEAMVVKQETTATALRAAQAKWYSRFNYRGENENMFLRKSFGLDLPGSQDFQETALGIFQPLFAGVADQDKTGLR